jgi:hypothetical protein
MELEVQPNKEEMALYESTNSTPYFIDTENIENSKFDWFEGCVKSLTLDECQY